RSADDSYLSHPRRCRPAPQPGQRGLLQLMRQAATSHTSAPITELRKKTVSMSAPQNFSEVSGTGVLAGVNCCEEAQNHEKQTRAPGNIPVPGWREIRLLSNKHAYSAWRVFRNVAT